MRAELEFTSDNQVLKQVIVEQIERESAISFREFMEMVLYHPQQGYYNAAREKMGRDGDYITSPEVSPVFAAMVGRQMREMWETLDHPSVFQIVEAGAGNGVFCNDFLAWARRTSADFFATIEYHIVELSPALIARQRELIEREFREKVRWDETLRSLAEGCIFSNELLDSMPVHRVTVVDGSLREIFVGFDEQRFVEELRPASSEIRSHFERLGLQPGEGCTAEANLAAPRWIEQAAQALGRGFLLTFDYGYQVEELYAPWRRDGTLLCFYRHNPSNDPYARIGRQDMTSHVDFTTLRRAGEGAGLTTLGMITQSEFLMNLGMGEALPAPGEGEPDLEGYFARRRAVLELLDPGGLGRIKALVQSKGVDAARLSGFNETNA